MSEIFERNLSFISKYNKSLCDKLLKINELSIDIQLNTNLVGEYNLLLNGMPVHSITGAEQEAKDIFSKLSHNTDNSIHVIYGLGLGYLYDVFAESCHGSVIVYEDDLELLRYVLEIVDFTQSFQKKVTFFVSDLSEYKSAFDELFRFGTKVSFSSINYYCVHKLATYSQLKTDVERFFTLYEHNFNFQAENIFDFFKYTVWGVYHKLISPFVTDYPNILENKPAVIVSAGPSLAKNIEFLKKYKDNVVIFCVGTALKTLLKNGIVPDFLHVIEKVGTRTHYNVPETKDMILVCEPYTNCDVYEYPFKKTLITSSEETEVAHWFSDICDKDFVKFQTKGTVSYHALYTAKYFGCNPIILIGQDLAYQDGKCYAQGSDFEDLECKFNEDSQKYYIYPKNYEKYRDAYLNSDEIPIEEKNQRLDKILETFNKDLVTVDGQNGDKLPTSNAYALFIEYIKQFGLDNNKDIKLINSSLGGAKIDGFELMSLDSALSKFANTVLDKSVLYRDDIFISDIDLNSVVHNIKEELESCVKLIPLFEKGKVYVSKLRKELNSRKFYTDDAELYLQKAATLYVEITNNFTNPSRLLRMATMREHYRLSYLMKEYKNIEKFDIEIANIFCVTFEEYFNNVHERILWINSNFDYIIRMLQEVLNESSCPKS